jgi:hypothetical protein
MCNHAILLIMVPKNHQSLPHLPPYRLNPGLEDGILKASVGGQRAGGISLSVGGRGRHG